MSKTLKLFYPYIKRQHDGTWRVYWNSIVFDDFATNGEAENAIVEYDSSFDCEEAFNV